MLVQLYYHLSVAPGLPMHVVATCADALEVLTRPKNKLSVQHLRLPWMPILDILKQDLFLTRRQFEVRSVTSAALLRNCLANPLFHSQTSYYMGLIAQTVRRFFHPAAIDEMLSVFVPMLNGTSLDVYTPHISLWPLTKRLIEHPCTAILHADVPASVSSSVLLTDAFPCLGIDQFLHV